MYPKRKWRWAHALLAVNWLANGLWMLAAPEHWYATLPGTTDTGPYNAHLVRDFGVAFLLMGAFPLLGLWRGWFNYALHIWITLFFSMHAGIHAWEYLAGHRAVEFLVRDLSQVLPPVILLWLLALPGAWEKKV